MNFEDQEWCSPEQLTQFKKSLHKENWLVKIYRDIKYKYWFKKNYGK